MTKRVALSILFALGALGVASCSSNVEQSSVTSGGNTGGGGGNAGGGDSGGGGGNAGGGDSGGGGGDAGGGGSGGGGGSAGGGGLQCDKDDMKGLYLGGDAWEPGDHCDGIYICTPDSSYSDLNAIYPGIKCEVGICEGSTPHCTASYSGEVTQEQWEKLCAASLIPGIDTIYCVIYGP